MTDQCWRSDMATLLQDKHHILPAAELTEAVQDARNRTLALVAA